MARPDAAAAMIALSVLLLLAPHPRSQDSARSPAAGGPGPMQGPPRRPEAPMSIEGVAATVNDVAILTSQLRTATVAQIRTKETELGRALAPAERSRILAQELAQLVDNHSLAQSAKTLGILPPERVEQIFREQLREEEDDQVRDLGSWLEFSRALKSTNRTWQTFYLEQRLEKMARLAEEMTIWSRLQNQGNLFITPQMMRDYYRKNRGMFVHDGAAIVAVCAFVGADAEKVAREAAAVWRAEEISSEAIEKRFADRGARALSDLGPITNDSRQSQPAALVDFALAGPKNAVQDPVEVGSTWRVWKVVEHRPAEARQFDDPAVQEEIRRQLNRFVMAQLRGEAYARAHERTHVWYAREFRGMVGR